MVQHQGCPRAAQIESDLDLSIPLIYDPRAINYFDTNPWENNGPRAQRPHSMELACTFVFLFFLIKTATDKISSLKTTKCMDLTSNWRLKGFKMGGKNERFLDCSSGRMGVHLAIIF